MRCTAVIFDLDGTLVDSLGDLAHSMNEVLESMGHPTHPTEPYRRFVGDGIVISPVAPCRRMRLTISVEEAVRRMREVYGRRCLETVPYPGIPELLKLRALELKTAVLSNKPDGNRQIVFRFSGACIRSGTWAVRHPAQARPDLGSRPPLRARGAATDVLYLGDTKTDMQTGRRAGVHGRRDLGVPRRRRAEAAAPNTSSTTRWLCSR